MVDSVGTDWLHEAGYLECSFYLRAASSDMAAPGINKYNLFFFLSGGFESEGEEGEEIKKKNHLGKNGRGSENMKSVKTHLFLPIKTC